jgi:ABC-2 type transport system permease protein
MAGPPNGKRRRTAWGASARAIVRLSWARTMTPLLLCGILALVLLPVVFALAFASRAPLSGDPMPFLVSRYDQLVCTIAVPLLALLLGTSAFSAEANDGTLMYLVMTTTPRWWMALVRILFAAVGTAGLSALSVWTTGHLATGWADPLGVTRAFVAAVALGGAAYAAGFTALALVTKRALVGGLVYVLFWEGMLSGLFPALHYLSVHQWMLAVARALTDAVAIRSDGPSARGALMGSGAVVVLALFIVTQRLAHPRLSRIGN